MPNTTDTVYGVLIIQANETASLTPLERRPFAPVAVLAIALFFGGFRKRKRLVTTMLVMLAAVGTFMMTGCNSTLTQGATHTSTFTLSATSGTVVHNIHNHVKCEQTTKPSQPNTAFVRKLSCDRCGGRLGKCSIRTTTASEPEQKDGEFVHEHGIFNAEVCGGLSLFRLLAMPLTLILFPVAGARFAAAATLPSYIPTATPTATSTLFTNGATSISPGRVAVDKVGNTFFIGHVSRIAQHAV